MAKAHAESEGLTSGREGGDLEAQSEGNVGRTSSTDSAPSLPQSMKGGKLAAIIGYRIKVTLNDSRTLTGQMLAFDKHMNLVISECEEFRRVKSKKPAAGAEEDGEEEMKRVLGLVILRGETIVTLSVEGPPPVVDESKGPQVRWSAGAWEERGKLTAWLVGLQISAGPGMGAPAGRGMGLSTPTMCVPCLGGGLRTRADDSVDAGVWLLRLSPLLECLA